MRTKGFTLIELLLVIAIVLAIAALMSPVIFTVRQKALIVSCNSNIRQVNNWLVIYGIDSGDGYIPRTGQDVEARNHPNHLREPGTRIPNLKGLLVSMGVSRSLAEKILTCPADKGSYGQDYYPTPARSTCWQEFGQSLQVNIEMYVDPRSPAYNPQFDGPMFGANPMKRPTDGNPSQYMVLSDMFSHWHNQIPVNGEVMGHYINILYYDGHVAGRAFPDSLSVKQFLNRDSVKRWWQPPEI
jgi:prepilin-type N-terminal cleavage/methylation domain-containing protein/prepilin-type processing-associated H-X9-DG protein